MRGGFGLQWHLTDRCDQRCKHCYIWSAAQKNKHSEPTKTEVGRIINDFCGFCTQMDCQPIMTLTGGDPILYSNFWFVLEELHARAVPIIILGNPFHLNNDNLARMKELGVQRYQVSLDGLQATHDQFRKTGSFETTVDAIRLINAAGITSSVMATVSRANWLELPELAKLCASLEVGNFAFARYCSTRKGLDTDLTPQEYRNFLAKMWAVYSTNATSQTNFVLKDHLFTAFLFEEGLFKPDGESGIIYGGCNCGIRHMALLPNGIVYACRRFISPIGNIHTSCFSDIFTSAAMEKYRCFSKFEQCARCELLGYCRGCPAVSASTNNNFYGKDPQCWREI